MTKGTDYIPQKEAELVDWVENFLHILKSNGAAWDIPQAEIDEIAALHAAFKQLHSECAGPNRTRALVAQKDAAKQELVSRIRLMVKFRFSNPAVTEAHRVEAGLHVHDATHTSQGVPATRPEFDIKVKDIRRLDIEFWDQGSTNRAKPYGMSGAVISYAVLDSAPAGPEALHRFELATRTPHTLGFREEDRGRTVYIVLQWQNTKGQRGPYSEILQAVIP